MAQQQRGNRKARKPKNEKLKAPLRSPLRKLRDGGVPVKAPEGKR